MKTSKTASAIAVLTAVALALPLASQAATSTRPHVSTGGAEHVLATSAELTAVIVPNGTPTSYYFQYGPTPAYGLQTPTVSVGSGTAPVKVGQSVTGLTLALYHFRVVGVYGQGGVVYGRDHTFTPQGSALKFELPKLPPVPYGGSFILSGTLAGLGNANHAVVLQATPYPYLQAFTNLGTPALTNASGQFAFRVANFLRNTQFRLITIDPRPVYSPMVTVGASVRVTLRVRSSSQPGLVRLFGTVTPAVSRARVELQLQKGARPGREGSARFATQFVTVTKRATRKLSRFSIIVRLRYSGRYRAYVRMPTPGPLVSGSSKTVLLRAAAKH